MKKYTGPLVEFDSTESIEDSAADLLGALEAPPNAVVNTYATFSVPEGGAVYRSSSVTGGLRQVRTGLIEYDVSKENEDFVLLLHYLKSIKKCSGIGPETLRKVARAYCGEWLLFESGEDHRLADLARALVGSFDMDFRVNKK